MNTSTWNIDSTHSSVTFSVRHLVFAKVRGKFATFSGSVAVDGDDFTQARISVSLDAASIDTGVGDRDAHLRSADFLDAEQFPKLTFTSEKIERTGSETYRVHGQLAIRGVARGVVLEATHGGQAKDPWGNQRHAFEASTTIDRRDFGLTWNQALETGGVLVGEKVTIELEVQVVAAAAATAA